jgi:hypothetical protein
LDGDRAPHVKPSVRRFLLMIVIDYNGTGFWSVDAVMKRHQQYARRFGMAASYDLSPSVHTANGRRWVYPVMDRVIEGIANGDRACAEIGVEFIEETASFPFGKILKSNTARALRRSALTDEQKERVRRRVVDMLCTGYLPREFREYAKLARKIGLGDWLSHVERQATWRTRGCSIITGISRSTPSTEGAETS